MRARSSAWGRSTNARAQRAGRVPVIDVDLESSPRADHDVGERVAVGVAQGAERAAEAAACQALDGHGVRQIFSTGPVGAPSDLSRRVTWEPRGDATVHALLRAAHGSWVVLDLPALLRGLTTGAVDTVITTATAMAVAPSVPPPWARLSYVTDPPVALRIAATVVGYDTYAALPTALQRSLDATALQAHSVLSRLVTRDDERYYDTITTSGGYIAVDTWGNSALWEAVYDHARSALVGTHYTRAMLDAVVAAGR